jgi:TDG/mug DNA glycosylase family protein
MRTRNGAFDHFRKWGLSQDQRPRFATAPISSYLPIDLQRQKRAVLGLEGSEISLVTYEPDILERGLDVIFCGLNPALSAAVAGHNFSHRNNRFWAVLHLAGFTDVHLHPEDERRLLEYGCGITAIIHRPTRRAEEITTEEFGKARSGFEAKMRHYAPRSIAFLGKRGFSIMTGQSDVEWGRYPSGFGGTMAWILPNPSGLSRSFTLEALVRAYSELRAALPRPATAPGSNAARKGRGSRSEEIRWRRQKTESAGRSDV